MKRVLNDKRGTALLVALLVMGVLMSISLALSTLIIREISTTKDVIDSGRAFYAAESGVEIALYKLDNTLPGWDTEKAYIPLELDSEYNVVGEYLVNNKCKSYPCFDGGYEYTSSPNAYYNVLDLNESVTIPLFTVDMNESEQPVTDFTVEFYMKLDPETDLKISGTGVDYKAVSGWDVLRWKIFGIGKVGAAAGKTVSISDFTAISTMDTDYGDESFNTNALYPSWFGTTECDLAKSGRVTDQIDCKPIASNPEEFDDPLMVSHIIKGVCSNLEAREYYDYASAENGKLAKNDLKFCYPIYQFLDPTKNRLNYLTLTNMVNPAVFKDATQLVAMGKVPEELYKLYYRVEFFNEDGTAADTERNEAEITSNGYSGDVKQSVSVKIRKGEVMPVFHFSLYSTYKNDDHSADGVALTGAEFYYQEEYDATHSSD